MFMFRIFTFPLILFAPLLIYADDGPKLGIPLSPEEVAMHDYVVMPDGDGLPKGSGNAMQGKDIYELRCLACHGIEGKKGLNDELNDGHGTVATSLTGKTVGSYWPYATTIFDYIRRAMPYQTPGIFSNDEIYALTAYLLFINNIIDENEQINSESLPKIIMPNQENFVWSYQPK